MSPCTRSKSLPIGASCFDLSLSFSNFVSQFRPNREISQNFEFKLSASLSVLPPFASYDLLCIEGLGRALNAFRSVGTSPTFKLLPPKETIVVEPSVVGVRQYVVCAVLRNITFTQQSYDSFIDLQDKLHRNICRNRTLASIGTHDMDTIQGPYVYRAEKPEDIKFVPLTEKDGQKSVDARQLMVDLEQHAQLKNYLHIIREKPLYPVLRDAKGVVLSLPPIINGNHSKITLNTKNVFIEVTALDMTKARVVLDTVVTMFSEHCSPAFEVEQVNVVIKGEAEKKEVYPNWDYPTINASVQYINSAIGLNLTAEEMVVLLAKMSVVGTVIDGGKQIAVKIPPTRSDIMHECDIMEDVAIAYGFNNLKRMAPKTVGEGKQLPVNKLTDSLRVEIAQQGFLEMLSFILSTKADNYENMNLPESKAAEEAVELSNPKGNIQICRTSMLPGLLKSLSFNKGAEMPVKVFEIGDIVLRDATTDVGARNQRQLAAVYMNNLSSGFEQIHGLLDRVMLSLNVESEFVLEQRKERQLKQEAEEKAQASKKGNKKDDKQDDKKEEKKKKKVEGLVNPIGVYTIAEASDPSFLPGRCVRIIYNNKPIGTFGVIHPVVLEKFHLICPVSALVMDVEPFL